jgi:HSP20 family protein
MKEQTSTVPAATARRTDAPFAPFNRLRDEIDRLFDDFNFARPGRSIFAFPTQDLTPPLELAEKDDSYELTVELPGLEEKDIDIEYADGLLTVSGEKNEQSEKKDGGYFMSERRYGSFRRQVTLPADIDPNAIDAKFNHGVLKLSMKKDKTAPNRSRKIKIG